MDSMKFEQLFIAQSIVSRMTIQISELQNAISRQQNQILMFMGYSEDALLGDKVASSIAESNAIVDDLTNQITEVQSAIARQNEIIDLITASGGIEDPLNLPPEEEPEDPDGSTDNP